jgi:DNA repair exonuclease SbcCD ATPase subunit
MKPITLKSISIRNFMSWGNATQTVDLTRLGSTLILGVNLDNPGAANGVGKTTLINAITYAIYNKPFDDISLQRLINRTNDAKGTLMEVSLDFSVGTDDYTIYRCRGSSTNIKVTKNGEDITLDSVNENDKLSENIIGISYELFTKIIIFSGSSIPFLKLPVSQQRDTIEEIFNITTLSEKAALLKERIKETESTIKVKSAVLVEQEKQVAAREKLIKGARERVESWEVNQAAAIKRLETLLETGGNVNFEDEIALHALVKEIDTALTKLQTSRTAEARVVSELKGAIAKGEKEIQHLEKSECPFCHQSYADSKQKLLETQSATDEAKALLLEKEKLVTDSDELIEAKKTELREAKSALTYSSLAEAISQQNEIGNAHERLTELRAENNPHVEALEQLTNGEQISVSEDGAAELDALMNLQEHQQFLLKLLTDKNSFVRRNIINRSIPFMNSRLNYHSSELGLPHSVNFDDNMTCTVSECGRELDFGNLSAGEKKRVSLALALTFNDVFTHLHGSMNVLFIDEIDASLDEIGVNASFDHLKRRAKENGVGIWLISHRPEAIDRFDRTVIFQKEGGFCTMITD